MFTVYALYNERHDKIYIGQTRNLSQRLKLHEKVEFPHAYTARFSGDWVVIYTEQTNDCAAALKREKALKSYRGREFVRSNIPR